MLPIDPQQPSHLFQPSADGTVRIKYTSEQLQGLIEHKEKIKAYLGTLQMDSKQLNTFANELALSVSHQFNQVNQYINLTKQDEIQLQTLFKTLLNTLHSTYSNESKDLLVALEEMFVHHHERIMSLLTKSNGNQLFQSYLNQKEETIVPCQQYSPSFQMKVLGLSLDHMQGPILDIGCGSDARLVNDLREQDVEAYGFDRNITTKKPYLFRTNWFDFYFSPLKWGTLISNMAFSNHFWHHHLRQDGQYESYAQKYVEILNALKVGGTFIYSPGLPFMENILKEVDKFEVSKHEIPMPETGMDQKLSQDELERRYVTKIKRLHA